MDQQPPVSKNRFVLEFTKMSGAGNDFIVIDNRFFQFPPDELSAFAVRFCPRRTGIGADGLLALCTASEEGAHYRMKYYNADGSLGTMCGNGARCLARFAFQAGIQAFPLVFDTDAGRYRANVSSEPGFDVTIELPVYERFRPNLEPTAGGGPAHFIWTGTEHVVVFVEDVEAVEIEREGLALRSDARLSSTGANVNFVQHLPDGSLKVRTFEKGVEAETLACGTGAVASAMVSALTGHSRGQGSEVRMSGGTLRITWKGSPESPTTLSLSGPAQVIYRGSLEL